ncbi:MAG TPA: hypothetical protein VN132_10450 [Bdellovibrio sp.]|nr:hypothetical protein [Bdellovibrio sp.]
MTSKRYELYRGREVNGQLTGLRICGYAFQNEGDSYYRIKLFLFPENTYFMSKNMGDGYTLFAKQVTQEDGKVGFQNPIGFAKTMESVRTHLYVRFPDLGSHMFMSLFPKDLADAG